MKLKTLAAIVVLALPFGALAQTRGGGNGAQLKADVEKLMTDVKTISAGSDVTQDELQALRSAVNSIVTTGNKPDPALVSNLQTTVKNAKADGTITNAEKAQIYQAGMAVLNSANVTPAQVQAVMSAAKMIAQASNITQDDVMLIKDDIFTIINDLPKKNP
ncbi:MAG: hypothetical protein JST12_12955 [Armatimonadetes bacterium]|nr:hypothetical protein [Armatimonadota bacterium]